MELLDDVCHTKSCFGLFGDSVSFGARFAHNAAQAKKPFWTHPMVLLGEQAQMEARYGLFGDSANPDAREEHSLRGTQAKKLFWMHTVLSVWRQF